MSSQLAIGLIALSIFIGIALLRSRAVKSARKARRREAALSRVRELPLLEKEMAEKAFAGPQKVYGAIFTGFSVLGSVRHVRMDVQTRPEFHRNNVFTKLMIVRHLWRTLKATTPGTAEVVVDNGTPNRITWTEAHDAKFDDRGIREPWLPVTGPAGTLISGQRQNVG
jgi:hypothetical protein